MRNWSGVSAGSTGAAALALPELNFDSGVQLSHMNRTVGTG